MQPTRVQVTSRDGTVTVLVDESGAMTDLGLSESAFRNGAATRVAFDRHRDLVGEFNRRLRALQSAFLPGTAALPVVSGAESGDG